MSAIVRGAYTWALTLLVILDTVVLSFRKNREVPAVGSEFQGGESCRVVGRFIGDAADALTVGVSQAASTLAAKHR